MNKGTERRKGKEEGRWRRVLTVIFLVRHCMRNLTRYFLG